jgi:putative transposase
MSRTARVIVPGIPLHITQRGTRRFDVFRDIADRLEYIKLLSNWCREFHLSILAYCLMTNHVHYVAIPERTDSVHRVFRRAHGTYAKRFNTEYGFVGHLWQERPNSCLLDEAHLWSAIRYVERNPVRAGMVVNAVDYRWSSAAAHCYGLQDPLLTSSTGFANLETDWVRGLSGADNDESDRLLRECTKTGRPCGDETFIKTVGIAADRDFTRKKPGRKPKAAVQEVPVPDWSQDRNAR